MQGNQYLFKTKHQTFFGMTNYHQTRHGRAGVSVIAEQFVSAFLCVNCLVFNNVIYIHVVYAYCSLYNLKFCLAAVIGISFTFIFIISVLLNKWPLHLLDSTSPIFSFLSKVLCKNNVRTFTNVKLKHTHMYPYKNVCSCSYINPKYAFTGLVKSCSD